MNEVVFFFATAYDAFKFAAQISQHLKVFAAISSDAAGYYVHVSK